tara:strand:+ start:6112 stop:7509 length:1398 start_codon:yes stop_codon:yes gene_type:complete
MSQYSKNESEVLIIGGGLAGLTSAWYLQKKNIPYTLIESSNRFGGLIESFHVDGNIIEFGPDSFITRKPWAMNLVKDLGIDDKVIFVNKTQERIYIFLKNKLIPLPQGLRLLVPTKIFPFLFSSIMSTRGKLRLLLDIVLPKKNIDIDESVENFVTRRFGKEALDNIAEPILGGVYNSQMSSQSILSTFPQFKKLEKDHRSLIRGMHKTNKMQKNQQPYEKGFVSLKEGMGSLINTLAKRLNGNLLLDSEVTEILENNTVKLKDGAELNYQYLILATQANISSKLLENINDDISNLLGQIKYESVGCVSFVFNKKDIPDNIDAHGVVVPGVSNKNIDGIQFSSYKWDDRVVKGKVLIRAFFGGPNTREVLKQNDDLISQIVLKDVREILKIEGFPLNSYSKKWINSYPQYGLNHKSLIAKIEKNLSSNIKLSGNAYHGIGMPDTINSAKRAVDEIEADIKKNEKL